MGKEDRWGNRTGMWDAVSGGNQIQSISLSGTGGIPTNQIASVTTNGASTVNYSYDAAGNVTNDGVHSYGYDSANRIVSVDAGSTASYAYDHQNRRYKKTIGSTVTHYVWQGSQVLAEHNGSTGSVLIDYVYSGSRMIAKVASGSTQYFLSDRLSVRLSLDSGGNVSGRQGHLPFGEDFGEGGVQDKHHFTSYERDAESGTNYALNRQYSQNVGRFMRVDPVHGSRRNPQNLNRYVYVSNNPLNVVDPLGLFICRLIYDEAAGETGETRIECVPDYAANHSALSTVDDVPDESSGDDESGGQERTETQLRDDFFEHHPGCKKPLDEAVQKLSGTTVVGLVATFRNTAQTDDLGKTLGELGFTFLTPDEQKVLLKDVFFDPATGQLREPFVNALTNPTTHTVYLNPVYQTTSSDAERTIVHELLHIGLNGFKHTEIANALGLTDRDGKPYTDDTKAKKALNDYLDGNCQNKRAQ